MTSRPLTLALLAALACPAFTAAAQTPPTDDTRQLDRVVVTATRTARAIVDVPNTVDEIDRERMDELLVQDLKDLFRHEPGITVTNNFGRFGIGDIRIRGLGGNRVRIQTDGIAVSDAFEIGAFSNANRNFVDLDTLKRVEVVRGPTSSMYGSDALGGTVSFVTKDPADYLDPGETSHYALKLGYDGESDGRFGGFTGAFGGDRWSGLVALGYRQGHERDNRGEAGGTGSARTRPNPQDNDGRSVLAKLVHQPSWHQRFKLTVEGTEDRADTELLTSLGLQPMTGATNERVAAHDEQRRTRVSFSHELDLDGGLVDTIDWQAYVQDSRTTQYTLEERSLPAPTLSDVRERWFHFDQRVTGLQANFRKSLGGTITHDLAWGLDLARTSTEQYRDGLRSFPLTGASTPSMPPDDFPVRDFPLSRTTNAAAYLQDEIGFADGRFRLVPAVRVDRYELEPRMDAIFEGDNPGIAITGLKRTSVSPKLGAVWHFAPQWSLFGGYARGFRAPPYADVNIGLTNLAFGYTAIANPDLKPETSDGYELGLRYSGPAAYFSVAAYDNRYQDFIESFVFTGFNEQGLMVFQSQNVADARIHGVEAKAGVDLGKLATALDGWRLRGAAAWSRGEDRTADAPLESIDPPSASLGLAYDGERWGAELAGRFAARNDRLEDPALFRAPGYGVLDLYAHWRLAPGARLNVGVTNLADRKYWAAGDIPLGSGTASIDRYTAPGRALSASITLDW